MVKVKEIFKKLNAPQSMIGNTAEIDIGDINFDSYNNNQGYEITFTSKTTPEKSLEINHDTHMMILYNIPKNSDTVNLTVWKNGQKTEHTIKKEEL